jgi:hypothetical protein
MNKLYVLIMFCCAGFFVQSQNFIMPEGVDEIVIPVEVVSNLMILKVNVNGTDMRFILDSGAIRTTIFNINGIDSLTVGDGERTTIKGYGSLEPFEAVNSKGNIITIKNFIALDADMYVLTEEQISFVPILGQEVNGIMGIDFFKNHLIELDYSKDQITIAPANDLKLKKEYESSAVLDTDAGKPYIMATAINKGSFQDMSLLLDTGSGDALWFFEKSTTFNTPKKGFRDYLGFGLSGDVYGFRSKIDALTLSDFTFNRITVAFPESNENRGLINESEVKGSLGGEVLRRFKILMDYAQNRVYFSRNRSFDDGFYYNMAGLKLREGNKELVTQVQYNYQERDQREARSIKKINPRNNKTYFYTYNPAILVSYVVPDSPADKARIKEGDQILRFNNKEHGRFSMGEVSQLFYKDPYSTIKLEMKRGEKFYTVKLDLVPIIGDDE